MRLALASHIRNAAQSFGDFFAPYWEHVEPATPWETCTCESFGGGAHAKLRPPWCEMAMPGKPLSSTGRNRLAIGPQKSI
jgi:hypothetical protein